MLMTFHSVFAGGSDSKAQIVSFSYSKDQKAKIEISWIREIGISDASGPSKFVFDFQNWPEQSYGIIDRFLPWLRSEDKNYPREKFDECLKFLKQGFESKREIYVGQMGTVDFVKTEDGYGIVPYADMFISGNHEACYLYASKI